MAVTRVLRTAAATLARTFYVDETLTDETGTVNVTVTRLDGTVVVASTPATHVSSGLYTFLLPGGPAAPTSATWQLDHLDVTWSGVLAGATMTLVDRVEVVGGYLFGLAEARASDTSLADTVKYTTAMLAAERVVVEQECEAICGRAFVPRFKRRVTNGTGNQRLVVPDPDIRLLRAATVAWTTGNAGVALATGELSQTVVTEWGEIVRGFNIWPYGVSNVTLEYEFGWDQPPADLRDACLIRMRSRLNSARSGIPDRAASFTSGEGGVYRLSMPSSRRTGIPDVDAVYSRYSEPLVGSG